MIKIAIVEDNFTESEILKKYLKQFAKDEQVSFSFADYTDGLSFLSKYHGDYDIVFLDIMMPGIDGIDTAQRLREADSCVNLIFVTSMAKYALKGYEFDAVDFIVKPISYAHLCRTLRRVLKRINVKKEKEITVNYSKTLMRLKVSQIYYVEVVRHKVVYHTEIGNFEIYGTMKDAEKKLADVNFFRSNNCYLINLTYLSKIDGEYTVVNGERLLYSKRRKKDLLTAMSHYMENR